MKLHAIGCIVGAMAMIWIGLPAMAVLLIAVGALYITKGGKDG